MLKAPGDHAVSIVISGSERKRIILVVSGGREPAPVETPRYLS
jgi:hypothetical protein